MSAVSPRLAAMNLLARREHSQLELRQKLSRRHFDSELLQQALEQLSAEGLQSDRRFTESFIHGRLQKGQGPLKIRHDLKQRGVSSSLIEQTLTSLNPDWWAQAEIVRLKRFGEDPPVEAEIRAKQIRFLQNRGFSHEHLPDCLRR